MQAFRDRVVRAPAGVRLCILVLAMAAGASGCEGRDTSRSSPPNIAMIVLDTARPDRLSVYGHERPTTPFLESFGARAKRFDRAYSSSSWTLPSHASLFSGASPKVHDGNQTFARVSHALPLLPEQLRSAGYETAGFSGNIWVTEFGGLARGFEHFEDLNKGIYSPRIKRLANDFSGGGPPPEDHYVVKRVLSWLDGPRSGDRPLFLFVNLVEPHLPYLPSWRAAKPFVGSRQLRWNTIQRFYPGGTQEVVLYRHYARRKPLGPGEWQAMKRMYDGTLRMTDGLVRALVRAIDAAVARGDPSRETLIFILSDHGENLGDHGHLSHIFNLYDSNIRIALIARGPGFEAGSVEERLVHITDVHATALAAAGIELPPAAEGVDLRHPIPSDRVLSASLEYPQISLGMFPDGLGQTTLRPYAVELAAAVGPRFKLIRSTSKDGDIVSEEVFDLVADPEETKPLDPSELETSTLDRLRAALETAPVRPEAKPQASDSNQAEVDDAVLEGLRALGYVRDADPEIPGSKAGSTPSDPGPPIDERSAPPND